MIDRSVALLQLFVIGNRHRCRGTIVVNTLHDDMAAAAAYLSVSVAQASLPDITRSLPNRNL
jgi:hypothetical protein